MYGNISTFYLLAAILAKGIGFQLKQVLKTTVMLLLRHGSVKPEYKDDLKKKMLFFTNVDTVEPTSIKWSSIRFQRNNQNYRMLLSICQLVIEGMLLTTDNGYLNYLEFPESSSSLDDFQG